MSQPIKRATIDSTRLSSPPEGRAAGLIPLRGPSGRLYGRLDPETMELEVKHPGRDAPVERIALRPYIRSE